MGDGKPGDRRERSAAMRKERERAGRRRRNLLTSGIVVAVVALVAVAAFGIATATDDGDTSAGGSSAFPEDGIVYQDADADDPVDVVVYEDFQCPHCAAFDIATRDVVEENVEDGTIRVAYEPLNYLDQAMSGATDYSLRAANAATCVYEEQGGQAFHEFSSSLYDEQRPEGSPGFSDGQYAAYAEQAGVDDLGSCLTDLPHRDEIERRTQDFATSEVGANGTPSVLVDGEKLADVSPEGLQAAIDEAAS